VTGPDAIQLDTGAVLRVTTATLAGRTGAVAVGVRPEKIRLGDGEANVLQGHVAERAYIGVSTQYVVDTPNGKVAVYVQNTDPGAHAVAPGDAVSLSFSPDAAFVVDTSEEVAT
jgi:spermidine/putrescine transport system ATP-binding protein